MNYGIVRTICISRYRVAAKLAVRVKDSVGGGNPGNYKREAAIWNIACAIAKGLTVDKASRHAPASCRRRYLAEAQARIKRLETYAAKYPMAALRKCQPLFAEWDARAASKAKAMKEATA